jgi:hypothetical protein
VKITVMLTGPVPRGHREHAIEILFRQFELEEILLPYFGANCVRSAGSVGSALVEM